MKLQNPICRVSGQPQGKHTTYLAGGKLFVFTEDGRKELSVEGYLPPILHFLADYHVVLDLSVDSDGAVTDLSYAAGSPRPISDRRLSELVYSAFGEAV